MDSCVERILEAISSLGIDQKSFAQMIGVRPQAITDWKNGKTISYKRHIEKIAEALGTTTEYLLTGNGPKKKTAPIGVSDSDTKPDWIIKFEELSPGAQKEVIAFIEFKRGQE